MFLTDRIVKCLDEVNYQVVPRFFLLYSSKRRILLIKCCVYSRALFTGNFASICGVCSRAAFNRINTVTSHDYHSKLNVKLGFVPQGLRVLKATSQTVVGSERGLTTFAKDSLRC